MNVDLIIQISHAISISFCSVESILEDPWNELILNARILEDGLPVPAQQVLLGRDPFEEIEPFLYFISLNVQFYDARLVWLS